MIIEPVHVMPDEQSRGVPEFGTAKLATAVTLLPVRT